MGAARVYDFIDQVEGDDTCPVLIDKDPPKRDNDVATRALADHVAKRMSLPRRVVVEQKQSSGIFGESLDPLIVGGLNASDNLLPYLAAVVTPQLSLCSAAFISPRWIMSAAHCRITNGSFVFPNIAALTSLRSPNVTVKRSFIHPLYNLAIRKDLYDFVVAELEEDAPVEVKFLKVNAQIKTPRDGEPVRALGYGRVSPNSRAPGAVLRQVDLRAISNAECNKSLQRLALQRIAIEELQLCARSPRERCGIWYVNTI